jgi:hypothetical protein
VTWRLGETREGEEDWGRTGARLSRAIAAPTNADDCPQHTKQRCYGAGIGRGPPQATSPTLLTQIVRQEGRRGSEQRTEAKLRREIKEGGKPGSVASASASRATGAARNREEREGEASQPLAKTGGILIMGCLPTRDEKEKQETGCLGSKAACQTEGGKGLGYELKRARGEHSKRGREPGRPEPRETERNEKGKLASP